MVGWPNGKALDYESRDCRFDPCVDQDITLIEGSSLLLDLGQVASSMLTLVLSFLLAVQECSDMEGIVVFTQYTIYDSIDELSSLRKSCSRAVWTACDILPVSLTANWVLIARNRNTCLTFCLRPSYYMYRARKN